MHILWDNLIKRAETLTATVEDANYPVENLTLNTDLKRFSAGAASTTIEEELFGVEDVSCIAVGNHYDLSTVKLILRNSTSGILSTHEFTAGDFTPSDAAFRSQNTGIQYLDSVVSGVDEFDVEIEFASSDGYIGGLFVGGSLYIGGIAPRPKIGQRDTGGYTKTTDGRLFERQGRVLRRFETTIPTVSFEDHAAMMAYYEATRRGKVVYIDPYEGIDTFLPYLANSTRDPSDAEKQLGYNVMRNITFRFEECR